MPFIRRNIFNSIDNYFVQIGICGNGEPGGFVEERISVAEKAEQRTKVDLVEM